MKKNQIKVFILMGFLAVQYQNCSKIALSDTSFAGKVDALGNAPILPSQGENPENVEDPTKNPTKNPRETENITEYTDPTFRVSALCSDSRSNDNNSNVVSAKTLEFQLIELGFGENGESKNKVVCKNSSTANIREALKSKTISLPNCHPADGQYELRLLDEKGNNLVSSHGLHIFRDGKMKSKNATVELLMDSNPNESIPLEPGVLPYTGVSCDEKKSPLYIDMRRDASDFDILSSPEEGIKFDIAGENAKPAPHDKYQISWFEKGKFALLALPNQDGDILGINELFGDNTKGPDGKFAENGFLSLAKYDSNGDGVISKEDEVFSKLRLWFDRDRDGRSKDSELVSLDKAKIVAIDLSYDVNFSEYDQYGNEIKYKSVVKFKGGKLKPIFDLWFVLK